MTPFSLQLETTTVEQDRTLKPILEYLPEHLEEVLVGVLKELDAKAINQGLVIDDCKRRLAILREELEELEGHIPVAKEIRDEDIEDTIISKHTARGIIEPDWLRGSVGDPFG